MEINLQDYILMVKKRLWLIVVFALMFTIPTAIYSNLNYTPIYQASSKLIANKNVEKDQMGREPLDYVSGGTNSSLINTYKELLKIPSFMEKVIQRNPDLNMTPEQLSAVTNVSDIRDTQIMTIAAQHVSYEKAVRIVNAVSEVFLSETPKIMKGYSISILTRAEMNDNARPLNKKSNQYIFLSLVASIVVAIGGIFLIEALDDTLKKEDDIRKILEVSTLGLIPKMKEGELRQRKKSTNRKKTGETSYAEAIE